MKETSKANARRQKDSRFHDRWFVGRCLEIGSGDDPLAKSDWPGLTDVVLYDREIDAKFNAQFLEGVQDESFDLVYSSHCLQYLQNTRGALTNWLRVLKPGGFLVLTVPEEVLYESCQWPSPFNRGHAHPFTLRSTPAIAASIDLPHLIWKIGAEIEKVDLLSEGWDRGKYGSDQSLGACECAIEVVLRKPSPGKFPL